LKNLRLAISIYYVVLTTRNSVEITLLFYCLIWQILWHISRQPNRYLFSSKE